MKPKEGNFEVVTPKTETHKKVIIALSSRILKLNKKKSKGVFSSRKKSKLSSKRGSSTLKMYSKRGSYTHLSRNFQSA